MPLELIPIFRCVKRVLHWAQNANLKILIPLSLSQMLSNMKLNDKSPFSNRVARVRQETRLWDTKEGVSKVMRSKEEAADYRYFA